MQFLSSLFGEKTLIFLGVVLALIVFVAVAAMLMRAFGDRAGRAFGGRTRQQRLGVVDAFDLDRQRQLVIVRRDNVEHLVMIGGPNDVVIESAIVRQAVAGAPIGARESYSPPAGAALPPRQGGPGPEGRPEFDPPAPEPALPVSPSYAPARTPATAAAPAPAAGGPRFPFPPQRAAPASAPAAAPQRAPGRDVARLYPAPVATPPVKEAAAAAPPPPAPPPPEQQPVAPPPPAAPVEAPPPPAPAAASAPRQPPRPGPSPAPRPTRPFPTLRQGGGPLFPVRSATSPPTKPGEAGKPPPPADASAQKNEMLESFESLEEEMAKLLGRPNAGGS